MSAAPLRIAPLRSGTERAATRPRLRIVGHTAPEATRVPFITLCVVVMVGALLGALGLNTSMAATSYTIRDRQAELALSQQEMEAVAGQVANASSPTVVMTRAAELGLVASPGVTYSRVAGSTLVGGQ